jgi:hypothetical protein
MDFVSHQVLIWGVDSVSDPLCAAIVDCIKTGGRPEDLADWPKNRATIEKVAAKYELINTAIYYNNAPFFHLFSSTVPQNLPPYKYMLLLQKCIAASCGTLILDCAAKLIMLANPGIAVLANPAIQTMLAIWCTTHNNYAALNWLHHLSPAPNILLTHVRKNAVKRETFDWLAARNFAAVPPDEINNWLCQLTMSVYDTTQLNDLIDFVGRDKIRNIPLSTLLKSLPTPLSGWVKFSWLLHCYTVDELLAFDQKICATAVLQHGASDLFTRLPPDWIKQFDKNEVFSIASHGGIAALNFVASLLPNFAERCYASLLLPNYCLTLEIFRHVLRQVSLTDDLLTLVAETNFVAFPERIPLIVSMKPDPMFWLHFIQRSTKISANTVIWFDNYFRSHNTKLVNFDARCVLARALVGGFKTGDESEILHLFGRVPLSADYFTQNFQIKRYGYSLPQHTLIADDASKIILRRLWWQHQRAKSGLLVAAALRARRAPHLPPELWNWFVHEYLSGL